MIDSSIKTEAFGQLLVSQSGATHFGSVYYAICTVLCWAFALLLLMLTRIRAEYPYLPLIFFAAGLLACATLFLRRMKSIAYYERGVIVKGWWNSHAFLHSEIAGVEFLAVEKYLSFIYAGTICRFELIPNVKRPVRLMIWGSNRDAKRIWRIVELILAANPSAQLLRVRH